MKAMMAIAAAAALATLGMVTSIARADPFPTTGACAMHQASIYFEKDAVELNSYSKAIIARLAAEAKACGRSQVYADAPNGALKLQRGAAIFRAFAATGVPVILVRATSTNAAPIDDSVLDRAAAVRVDVAPPTT